MVKKIFISSIFLVCFFLFGGLLINQAKASCAKPLEICDMPPGECGGICIMCEANYTGCIGPTQCVIDSGQFVRVGTKYTCTCSAGEDFDDDCKSCDLGDNVGGGSCEDNTSKSCGTYNFSDPYGGVGTCSCTAGAAITYEYCEDSVWNNCCTAPVASGFCGDGTCDADEDCDICEADCGICPAICDPVTADVQANGSDLDITVTDTYDISWASANADTCSINTVAKSLDGSETYTPGVEDDYVYNLECLNSCGNSDTDTITVTAVDPCGDGTCAGFENCSLCPADCGDCPTTWWQVSGGSLFSALTSGNAIISDIASSVTCIEPGCVPGLSIRDRAGTVNSDGFPITGGGAINNNGQMITYRDPDVYVIGTTATRLYENYSYFYSKFSLGSSPFDDYSASTGDALEPASSKDYYFHSGDMIIQSPWDVTNGESYVVFVDGNLTIEDPAAVGELIKVAEGGFLAFIVSGDINIADSVGHGVLTNSAGNIEGVFVADGTITIASSGTDDKKFVGEGTFTGWTNVALLRAYDELTSNNDLYPAETFVYRPDLVKNTPEKMKRAQMLWQETN